MRDLLGDLRGRALLVVLGCLICQFGPGFGYAIGALAPDMLAELGWSRATYSSMQGLPQTLLIAFMSPIVGFLVGRYGGRRVLACACVVLGFGYGLVAGMQEWWQFALASAVIGFGVAGTGDITVGATVTRWVTRSRGLALGIVYTGSNLGGTIATRGVSAVADATTWRTAVAAMAMSCVFVLLPAAWFAVRDRAGVAAPAMEDAPAIGGEYDLDARAALRTRSFWIIAAGLLGFWTYLYAMLHHCVLALLAAGIPKEAAAAHWANLVAMGIFSKIAFGWIADRVAPKTALLLDYGLLALSALLLLGVSGTSPVTTWAFVLLFGFSYAARDLVTPLIIVHCFGARNLAQIYGLLMMTILPGSAGSAFAGWVYDVTGSYEPAFAGLAATTAAAFALLFAVRDERSAQLST